MNCKHRHTAPPGTEVIGVVVDTNGHCLYCEVDDLKSRNVRLQRDHDAMLENLTHVQIRCTELLEANRCQQIRKLSSGFGVPIAAHQTIVLSDVARERSRGDALHGALGEPPPEGRPGADTYVDGTGGVAFEWAREAIRLREQRESNNGRGKWAYVLLEEVFEALAETDPKLLRKELIQAASVCCKWAEAIDRRIPFVFAATLSAT